MVWCRQCSDAKWLWCQKFAKIPQRLSNICGDADWWVRFALATWANPRMCQVGIFLEETSSDNSLQSQGREYSGCSFEDYWWLGLLLASHVQLAIIWSWCRIRIYFWWRLLVTCAGKLGSPSNYRIRIKDWWLVSQEREYFWWIFLDYCWLVLARQAQLAIQWSNIKNWWLVSKEQE